MRPTILAATGQLGPPLVARLAAAGLQPIAVGRAPRKLALLEGIADTRQADLTDAAALKAALADASVVVACGNAVHLPAILAALPPGGVVRLVAMGSTRVFSTTPDAVADAVRRGKALLEATPFESVMLLASMIYGGGIGVVETWARLAGKYPVLPVPDGPRIQPIHRDDVVLALQAAIALPAIGREPIVIAGPEPIAYRAMVERILAARGLRARTLPVPARVLGLAGRWLGRPALGRLAEDAVFDITPMRSRLGIEPRPFAP